MADLFTYIVIGGAIIALIFFGDFVLSNMGDAFGPGSRPSGQAASRLEQSLRSVSQGEGKTRAKGLAGEQRVGRGPSFGTQTGEIAPHEKAPTR